ncbi:MAG: methylated-DNA--[protein]-cysteine S-methyltransferase [Gemmatimonadaceae bacterium]|jgi:AraC family transcriptional regulator of adaptative response/methylated-DNA-[protein]-cysteine methyltransferase|nr:methylated-DNA--[protein]-cysteine S-methyltransferase [Gemmatimonadaceae bacterium]
MSMPTHAPDDAARIERALAWLDAHAEEQPSLDDAARTVALSPSHFQRMFTQWVGISPKRYVQAATAARARELLRASRPVLDTAFAVGLSGPSRLHDLLVATDGATPGDIARGGDGMPIRWGFHDTPFGEAFIAVAPRGLCALTFAPDGDRDARVARLARDWPRADRREDAGAGREVAQHLERLGQIDVAVAPPLALLVRGTNLQVRVWEALRRIPAGALATYEDVAGVVGAPTAVRAVASAIGRNPIHVLIPCHRVVRKTGHLGGYAGGLARKRAMLGRELA